jgi:hypothetical protein
MDDRRFSVAKQRWTDRRFETGFQISSLRDKSWMVVIFEVVGFGKPPTATAD